MQIKKSTYRKIKNYGVIWIIGTIIFIILLVLLSNIPTEEPKQPEVIQNINASGNFTTTPTNFFPSSTVFGIPIMFWVIGIAMFIMWRVVFKGRF